MNTLRKKGYLQHSIGLEDTCKERVLPLGWGIWTRKTSRTRVFFLPMSVSPFLSSMSEFLSFSIPAQSMLFKKQQQTIRFKFCALPEWQSSKPGMILMKGKIMVYLKLGMKGGNYCISWVDYVFAQKILEDFTSCLLCIFFSQGPVLLSILLQRNYIGESSLIKIL